MEKKSAPSSLERTHYETVFQTEVMNHIWTNEIQGFINAQEALLLGHF